MPTPPGRKTADVPPAQRQRLRAANKRVTDADRELRAAVRDAHGAGGSVRAIAVEIRRSTRTIQNWLHDDHDLSS